MYDEEIHDILAAHVERLGRFVAIAAMLGVAGYAVSFWIPDVSTFVSKSLATVERVTRTTATAAREASGAIATAAHDGWNAGE